jgi:phosphate transport system protein
VLVDLARYMGKPESEAFRRYHGFGCSRDTIMKRPRTEQPQPANELTRLALQGCLVAKDSAYNLRDFIENSSNMAFISVKDCEKELDRMERRIDEEIPSAITEVTENEARELLACLKLIIDLERIGDLTCSVALRLQALPIRLLRDDSRDLIAMSEVLEKMLDSVYQGFLRRDLNAATGVIQTDAQIDQLCRNVFRRHLESRERRRRDYSTTVLLMAQAFERAGDHTKNLGEELFHLVEGRSVRHEPKRPGRYKLEASTSKQPRKREIETPVGQQAKPARD